MKYIKNTQLPSMVAKKKLDELNKLKNDINSIANAKQRSAFIDDNQEKWAAIKQELWELGNHRCWYSEKRLSFGEAQVEHYRPKKKVAKTKHTGYYWEAFNWHNYRIAHPTCNKRITDYLTGKLCGKHTYFPIKDEKKRAKNEAEQNMEEPLLLDPVNPVDCKLIKIDTSSGRPIPSVDKDRDEWSYIRGEKSIDFYHLDEGTWIVERKDIIDRVNKICSQIIESDKKNDDAKKYELIDQLYNDYLHDYADFISVAKQVVIENGLASFTI